MDRFYVTDSDEYLSKYDRRHPHQLCGLEDLYIFKKKSTCCVAFKRKSRIFIPEIRHVRAMLQKRSLQCILMPRPDENQGGLGGHQPNNKAWPPLDAWTFR